jgi:Ca2+/H+ antiporter
MDAVQITFVASVATVASAVSNVVLVVFIYIQLRRQREFFNSQSRRDARTKISEFGKNLRRRWPKILPQRIDFGRRPDFGQQPMPTRSRSLRHTCTH